MRQTGRQTVEVGGDRPIRVLGLAAGPANELRRLLEEIETLARPVELILLDQDPGAHETAHRHLTKILLERHHGLLPVTVRCLHFSVRQLLKPQTPEEQQIAGEALADRDLVYAAALYDYLAEPIAARLTRFLYSRLRQGVRLLLANLVETPDTTWMMDYVLGWSLIYRTDECMLRLGA